MSDLAQTGRRVEQLLDSLASATEPHLRMHAEELVSSLLSLYGEGLARVMSYAGEQLRARLVEDELISELLVLHGLHPVDVETRVRAVVGAEAELLSVSGDGVARLRWTPAASTGCGCGSARADGKRRLEEAVLAAVGDVTVVEIEETAPERARPLIPVESLFRPRAAAVGR
jgi:hypothetical protein